jgi:hypothetical protein
MKIRNNEDDIKRLYGSLIGVHLVNNKLPSQPTNTSWLTKDRVWNLVFWFGISSGLSLGSFVKFTLRMPDLFLVIVWSTLLGVPLIVTLANRTCFIKRDVFNNSQGIELTKEQMPTGNFIWLTMLSVALTFVVSDKYAGRHALSAFFAFNGLLSGFSLYFIFKNCPISILFNYKFWDFKLYYGRQNSSSNQDYYDRMNRTHNSFNKITNPGYSYRPENIWHR